MPELFNMLNTTVEDMIVHDIDCGGGGYCLWAYLQCCRNFISVQKIKIYECLFSSVVLYGSDI
jgi:hypothetical protein